MSVKLGYDFAGWAATANVMCTDGTIIRPGAFKDNDGDQVTMVWQHNHKDIANVLGHALLEDCGDAGTRMYGYINKDTEQGQNALAMIQHGDIRAISIFANGLKRRGNEILHGDIKEVSLVLAPADPGAFIDYIAHSDGEDSDGAIIYNLAQIEIAHSDVEEEEMEDDKNLEQQELEHADDEGDEILGNLTDDQIDFVKALVGKGYEKGLEDGRSEVHHDATKDEGNEGENVMKHDVFDTPQSNVSVLAHSDGCMIIKDAKEKYGSLQQAMKAYGEANDTVLQHDATASGFVQPPTAGNVTMLFPDYKEVRPGAPELITNDQGWVDVVLNKVQKSPISRVRTSHVDIRNLEALRAKGYVKGKEKTIAGNISLARRETDPQTVYVSNALHKDDITDITDFDYVEYMYKIDRLQLNEELAMAIMLGDGREDGVDGKINPVHIRPIWTDDDLYTIHKDIDFEAAAAELQGEDADKHFGQNFIYSEAMVNACLYAREDSKGTGTPDMFISPHMLNVMLLARDFNGRRIYSSKAELASSLNVGNIYTAEQFANKTRTTSQGKTKKLLAIIVNLADYQVGSTKGGEVAHFTDFDLKFNQMLSLLETRLSGANTRLYSAIAIEEDVTESSNP